MIKETYLELKKIFAPEVLWELIPNEIPGWIIEKGSDRSGTIRPLFEIYYPDGELMDKLYCHELDGLPVGSLVIFRLLDTPAIKQSTKKQFVYPKKAVYIRRISKDEVEKQGYIINPAKILTLGSQLDALLSVVEVEKDSIVQKAAQKEIMEFRKRTKPLDELEALNSDKGRNVTKSDLGKIAPQDRELANQAVQLRTKEIDLKQKALNLGRAEEKIRIQRTELEKKEEALRIKESSLIQKEFDVEQRIKKGLLEQQKANFKKAAGTQEQVNNVEKLVTEKVAAQEMELKKIEASLKAREQDLSAREMEQQLANNDVLSKRAQLEEDRARFQQEGGEKFLSYLSAIDKVSEENNSVIQFSDYPLPNDLPQRLDRSFSTSQYSLPPELISKFLLSTLTAVLTGQFVVLSGPTGVGKTSMVNAFSSALGAGCGVVPVRPAWIDPTDLLGFYNPQQRRYQPSPFMDRFLEARQYSDANRLYFLTLDEMNLSRVENYAADFLSRFEKARSGEEDVSINLYSLEIEQSLRAEAQNWKDTEGPDFQKQAALHQHLIRYPANVSIPKGLVIFGTINLDETTYHLSPKFLDRSFVINIPHQALATDILKFGSAGLPESRVFDLSLKTARSLASETTENDAVKKIWQDVLSWQEPYLKPLGINPGFRFAHLFIQYLRVAGNLGLKQHYEVASTFFQAKLLPWLSFHKDDLAAGSSSTTKLQVLENWINDKTLNKYAPSGGLKMDLERILEKGSSALIVQYLE